eukprot:gene16429-34293_t
MSRRRARTSSSPGASISSIGASVGARVGAWVGSWVAVGSVLLAACGGGDSSASSTGTGPDGEAVVVVPLDTVGSLSTDPLSTDPLSTDPLSTDRVVTTPPSTVPPAERLPTLAFAPQSAGPLEVTASQCVVTGIPNEAPGAAVGSIALDATRAYVPADGG